MDPLGRRKTIRLIRDWARAGQEHHRLEPHPARDRVDDVEHPADQQRPDPRRGQRPPDSRPDRRASAHRLHPRRRSARARARVPGARRRAQPAVRAGRGRRRDRRSPTSSTRGSPSWPRAASAAPIDEVTSPDDNLQAVFQYLVKYMSRDDRPTARRPLPPAPGFLTLGAAGLRPVARRDALVAPHDLHGAGRRRAGADRAAVCAALVDARRADARRVNGTHAVRMTGPAIFGLMIWVFYLRFTVPVLGVFYGTSLIADEVEDKTITYLFTRPIPRGAVLVGKYLAYLVCTIFVVLPSVMLVYLLIVPIAGQARRVVPRPGEGPGAAGARAGGLRRAVRLRRRDVQAAAADRPDLRLRVGAGGAGVPGLPEAVSPWPTTCRAWCRTPCRTTASSA